MEMVGWHGYGRGGAHNIISSSNPDFTSGENAGMHSPIEERSEVHTSLQPSTLENVY